MITYKYRCENCNETEIVKIQTWDITKSKGYLDMEKFNEREKVASICKKCNNKRKQVIDSFPDVYWFEAGIGKGKISQRFK